MKVATLQINVFTTGLDNSDFGELSGDNACLGDIPALGDLGDVLDLGDVVLP
jgi:hypothetical protein